MKSIVMLTIFLLLGSKAFSFELKCGFAEGYAPFQYLDGGKNKGIDIEIVKVFNSVGPYRIKLIPGKWDSLVGSLFHLDEVDCLIGMERTKTREDNFLFSKTVYNRESVLVVLDESSISDLKSLNGKLVCGDKDSLLDLELRNSSNLSARLVYMETKERCFSSLIKKSVTGLIIPKRVALFLAKKHGVKIRVVHQHSNSTAVSFAFKRKGRVDLARFNSQLTKAIKLDSFGKIISFN